MSEMYGVKYRVPWRGPADAAPLPRPFQGGQAYLEWSQAAAERDQRQAAGQEAHIYVLPLADGGPLELQDAGAFDAPPAALEEQPAAVPVPEPAIGG